MYGKCTDAYTTKAFTRGGWRTPRAGNTYPNEERTSLDHIRVSEERDKTLAKLHREPATDGLLHCRDGRIVVGENSLRLRRLTKGSSALP